MAGVDIPKWMWALLDDYPFASPPPGVVPNFDHPHLVHYHSLTIACSISIVLLVFFSSVRLYAKIRIIRKTTTDDYFFWVTSPMLLLNLILYIYLDNNGTFFGYHAWEIKLRSLQKPFLIVIFINQILLPATVLLVKATLSFLILSAFNSIKWIRSLCWGGLVVMSIVYTASLIVQAVSCHPRGGTDRNAFLAGMASSQCAGSDSIVQKMSITAGIFGVVSDFYILLIPLPAVAKLKVSKKKKVGVYLIFSSGFLACLGSIIGLVFRVKSYGSHDLTVDSIPNLAAHMSELSVGLIITCIAPSVHFVRHFLGKHFPSLLDNSAAGSREPLHQFELPPRRKHALGGLSELDSMKTFGTTVDVDKPRDSFSLTSLSASASPYQNAC